MLRVVLAGCGEMSNVWLEYVKTQKNVVMVGLVDINENNAKSLMQKHDLNVPIFTDLAVALKAVKADVVFDVTIPSSHKEIVITALRAGCHVFGEKPMAESLEDAKEIIAVAKQTGRHYAVMQNRRYAKYIRSLQHFLQSGEIGTIGSIHADFFLGPNFGGFRDMMDHPLIIDMAIHTFDQARFLSNADPVSVYCQEYNPPGSWYKGNASAVCIFEMSNGSIFTYRGSWCSTGFDTSWESDWRITGSKGSVKWNGDDRPICEVADHTKDVSFFSAVRTKEVPNTWNGRNDHFGCLDEMFLSLSENRRAETDCMDNLKSAAMVFGAVKSAKTGEKVLLNN